jgi:formate dehydrogenase major subunit
LPLTRRDLLKQGLTAGSLLALLDAAPGAAAAGSGLKTDQTAQTRTICPYCSVGCGIVIETRDGEAVNAHGDPDHPINEGSLCSKGASVLGLRQIVGPDGKYQPNPRRLTQVLYRAPHSDKWEAKDWGWAMEQIARRVKDVRDATFQQKDEKGVTVNRTFALAHIGSAALDNEENYVLAKLQRALGVVRLEHHARL